MPQSLERCWLKKYRTTILKNIHSICLAQLLYKSLALVVFEYLSLLHYVFSYWSIQTVRKRPFKLNFNVIRYSLVGRPISVTQIKRVYKVTLDGNTETSLVNWKSPSKFPINHCKLKWEYKQCLQNTLKNTFILAHSRARARPITPDIFVLLIYFFSLFKKIMAHHFWTRNQIEKI